MRIVTCFAGRRPIQRFLLAHCCASKTPELQHTTQAEKAADRGGKCLANWLRLCCRNAALRGGVARVTKLTAATPQ